MWLSKRGYSNKLTRKQILKARAFNRDSLLENNKANNKKSPSTVLNLTYHPALSKFKKVLEKIHILLTPDKEHQKVFKEVPIIGFKRGKSLKDILVTAKLRSTDNNDGQCDKCGSKRCGVCHLIKKTKTFSGNNKQFKIRGGEFDCNSNNVVYMINCKTCSKQYVGSCTTKFRMRVNNYKNCYKKHQLGQVVPQQSFHDHFAEKNHNGIDDWEFVIIDKGSSMESVRKKEANWQNILNTFSPNGLNEKNVPLLY